MMRKNRAAWLRRFETEEIRSFRGPELKRWLVKHGLIEVVPTGKDWPAHRVVLTAKGRESLAKYEQDALRHRRNYEVR